LETAEKPLLYVGGGAIAANAHAQIAEFAERFQLPVTTTLRGSVLLMNIIPSRWEC